MKEEWNQTAEGHEGERLENALRQAFTEGKARSRGLARDCLNEESIAAFVERALSSEGNRSVEEHLAGCDFCLEHLVFLVRTESKELPEVPPYLLNRVNALLNPARPAGFAWVTSWQRALAAACVAVLAVGVGIRAWMRHETIPAVLMPQVSGPELVKPAESPQARESTSAKADRQYRRSVPPAGRLLILEPQEGAEIRVPIRIVWQPLEGSQSYQVEVAGSDGSLFWEGHAEGATLQIPAEAKLSDGELYYVRVKAIFASGQTERSAPVAFHVKFKP